jgi:ATP-dependent helicase/nuclease subunit A
VAAQDAVGARELEAVAEEEGADAVRLLTIHAAKGLEFKVVIVADAGRDKAPPASDEILALSDGRFGFRVADPSTSTRRGAFEYEAVRETRKAEEEAEKLRLYYVAMTRAKERLIVSGAIDRGKPADDNTPIGWVLGRLDAEAELEAAGDEPLDLERGGASVLVRIDRFRAEPLPSSDVVAEDGQLALFAEPEDIPAPRATPVLPPLAPLPVAPVHRVRRLSFTALSLFEQCSYRYYAQRVAGMRERRPERGGSGSAGGLAATEIGDAAHKLLEQVDLGAPVAPDVEQVRAWYPTVTEEELTRIAGFVESYCGSELAARIAKLDGAAKERHFTFEQDGVLLHGYLDVVHVGGDRALVLDYKTNSLAEASLAMPLEEAAAAPTARPLSTPEEIVEADYRLQRLVYALACFRAGAQEVEVVYHFLERPGAVVSTTFSQAQATELEAELSAAIARIQAGEFVPTPSEFVCATCPALDLVCAGPRLRSAPPPPATPPALAVR